MNHSSSALRISSGTARRTALACQGLYPPRSWAGKEGVKSYLGRVRSIQFDPINVVGRNPDLVLQSRVKDYTAEMLDELLYQERYLVDSWDKMASLSLVEDWPAFDRQRERMVDIFGIPSEVVMQLAPEVLEQIRKEGPQCSLDYQIERKTDWAWGPARVARACLEGLYKMGQLGVDHRVNNRRYFDFIENLLPDDILQAEDPNSSLEEYQRWHVLRRIGAIGLAHPNAGEHWNGIIGVKSARRREILQDLVEAGDVLEVEVENLPGELFYLRASDRKILQEVQEANGINKAAFLAPLDNLLWDRKSIQRLFDFDYVWEVYKPKKKRKFGYYVLPVIYGDQFVGRLDPSFDKNSGLLTINDWWWETGIEPEGEMAGALQDCLRDFISYVGAKDLEYSRTLIQDKNMGWIKDL